MSPAPADHRAESSEARPGVRKINSAPAEPVDLLEVAAATKLKRYVPLGVAALILGILAFRWSRR